MPAAEATTFGTNAQKVVFEQAPADWEQHFRGIARAGLAEVRVDALWQAIEPQPPIEGRRRFRWGRMDRMVAALARQGLRWFPVVGYSTGWAGSVRGNHRSPPRDRDLYAEFAGALAERYGRGGTFWGGHRALPYRPVVNYEIWNAPNFRATWFPPASYARAYLAVRRSIRRVDPRASVWVGGLADRAPAFLTAMYEAEPAVRGNVDGVGLHPYGEELDGVIRKVVRLRQSLQVLRAPDVPIAVTEVGWTTQGRSSAPHATDERRAHRLAMLAEVLALSDCGVEHFLPHTWSSLERDPADSEHWFGMVHPDGRPTLTSRGYAAAVRRAGAWRGDAATIPLCDI